MASPRAAVFEGLGKNLNVFSIEGTKLLKATSLKVDVPVESSTIIIIRGQAVSLVAAKLEGMINPEKLLFVAPEAISFSVRGDKFSGTVIAPKANIHLDARLEGSLFGANVRSMVVTKPAMYMGCMFARDQFQN
jgi:choice-of-anchor A domain-containing protein